MRLRLFILCFFSAAMLTPLRALELHAMQLQPQTKDAWHDFVDGMNSRIERDARHPESFLAIDTSPELRARVRAGEIAVYPATHRGTVNVPAGLIHDWVGHVFIPNTTGKHVIDMARTFERYPEFYKPSVLQAHAIEAPGSACEFSLLLRQQVLFVDAAIDGEYECTYSSLPPCRWYSVTTSTRLREILNYAHTNERRFLPDTGDGFIWRLHSTTKYEEADGGVYVELEAAALSRPIPTTLRWMVSGVVERISRSALVTSLRQTREATAGGSTQANSISSFTTHAGGN